MRPRVLRRLLAASAAGAVLAGAGIGWAADAHAGPNDGCETTPRPILLNWIQKRTICDSPRRADGSWTRTRVIWTPAHSTNGSSYCSRYSCSYTPPRDYEESVQEFEQYVVFDYNVLDGEPGWLPAGTAVLR